MYFLYIILTYLVIYVLFVKTCYPDPNEEKRNRKLIDVVSLVSAIVLVESFERIAELVPY